VAIGLNLLSGYTNQLSFGHAGFLAIGAYAAAITMAKVVLFAPIAVGFILLERTARSHARGEDTDRGLFVALAFVLATSGAVTVNPPPPGPATAFPFRYPWPLSR